MKNKFLFVAAAALAFPAFSWAQAATQFVKGAAVEYCWQDAKEFATDKYRDITFDDSQHLLKAQVGELRSGGGDISITIRTLPDKNKKGEEGCSIVVDRSGGAAAAVLDQRVNSNLESSNINIANNVSAFVASKEKARAKKAKKQ